MKVLEHISDPLYIYSTGQTLDDFEKFSQVLHLRYPQLNISFSTVSPKNLPPVLFDASYKPPNRGPFLISILLVVFIIAFFSVFVRVSQRVGKFQKLDFDDYLIVLGLAVLGAGTMICVYMAGQLQWGYSSYDLTMRSLERNQVFQFVLQYVFFLNIAIVRAAIILFIRRLHIHSDYSYQIYLCNCLLIFNFIFMVATLLGCTFQCRLNILAAYDIWEMARSKCQGGIKLFKITNAFNWILDVLILLVPLGSIMQLRMMSWRKKIEAVALLCVGVIALGASIARFEVMKRYQKYVFDPSDDYKVKTSKSWESAANAIICSHVECGLLIICSCVPAIRKMFSRTSCTQRTTFSKRTDATGSSSGIKSYRSYLKRFPKIHDHEQNTNKTEERMIIEDHTSFPALCFVEEGGGNTGDSTSIEETHLGWNYGIGLRIMPASVFEQCSNSAAKRKKREDFDPEILRY